MLHNSDLDCGMKLFSSYCVPQEEARDMLEQLLNVKLHRELLGRCVDASVSCQRVAGMYLSVEQVLKGEMLTLCLREEFLRNAGKSVPHYRVASQKTVSSS